MPNRLEVATADGRTLSIQDSGPGERTRLTMFWHNGAPHTGLLLPSVVELGQARGIRVVTYARPGYAGSTPVPGRRVAQAATDVGAIADALGIGRFAVVGYSGGGPHALACAALTPDRVVAAVTLASVAPFTDEFDWFAGMASPEALTAARQGREARARYAEIEVFNENVFIAADWSALSGAWAEVGQDAMAAGKAGADGLIDDDVAFASDWTFDPSRIRAPVLIIQGGADRMVPRSHGESLERLVPGAELWLRPDDGHISVLNALPPALDWLADTATRD